LLTPLSLRMPGDPRALREGPACSMKNEKQLFGEMVPAFRQAIIDRLAETAKANGGKLAPSTEVLLAAAFPAFKEVCDSLVDQGVDNQPFQPEVGPMLAIAVWEAVMKTNESAFRQHLMRLEKAKALTFSISPAAASAKGIAAGYLQG
jgi:hypothetical protein